MTTAFIGQPISRVDGRQKVTGRATYAAEFEVAGPGARRHRAEHGRERPHRFHRQRGGGTGAGVIAVLTHRNAPRLAYRPHKGAPDPDCRRTAARAPGRPGESSRTADRPCDRRHARTGEPCGDAGARHLRTGNRDHRHLAASNRFCRRSRRPTRPRRRPPETRRGDPEGALATAEVKVDQTYVIRARTTTRSRCTRRLRPGTATA